MDIISFLEDNWDAVSAAPWVFVAFAILFGGAGFALGRFLHFERSNTLQSRIDLLNDRLSKKDEDIARISSNHAIAEGIKDKSGSTPPKFRFLIMGTNIFTTDFSGRQQTGIILDVSLWNMGGDGIVVTAELDILIQNNPPETLKPRDFGSHIRLTGNPTVIIRREDSLFEKIKGVEVSRTPIEGKIMFISDMEHQLVKDPRTHFKLTLRDNYEGTAVYETSIGNL